MQFLPVVFTFMFINFASGLVLYWFVNNLLSILQQYLINRQTKTQQA
jgi:YidC/Oxa1 family membrane protein insertase